MYICNVSFETAILNTFQCTNESIFAKKIKDQKKVLVDSSVYNQFHNQVFANMPKHTFSQDWFPKVISVYNHMMFTFIPVAKSPFISIPSSIYLMILA